MVNVLTFIVSPVENISLRPLLLMAVALWVSSVVGVICCGCHLSHIKHRPLFGIALGWGGINSARARSRGQSSLMALVSVIC